MKLVLIALAVVGATAMPQHGGSYSSYDSFDNFPETGSALSPALRQYENIPKGCTFISSTQSTDNGVISGEYSYEDPVGSVITVTYSVNLDGTNYQESRKVVKGYVSDGSISTSGLITAEEVVQTIITELKPTVIQIIRVTVQQSSVDLSDYDNLVNIIMVQLRPVVTNAVNNALATSQYQHLNGNELIEMITVQLRPFVAEALRAEIEINSGASEDEVVTIVISELRPIVIRIIRETVKSSNEDLTQYENLVQTIMVQLRPVVFNEVQRALSTSTKYRTLDANSLTERIIVELTPFVRQGVQEQIELLQSQNFDAVVKIVIDQLRPIVFRVISETVRNSNEDLSQYQNLVQTIMTQLRGVVLGEVQRALRTSTKYQGLNAQDLTEKILVEIRVIVSQGVQEEIRAFQQELESSAEEVVRLVISQLRSVVLRIIKATVRSASPGQLGSTSTLIQTISTQLRPVVLAEVQRALATSTKYQNVLKADDLTQRIIIQLRPLIQQGIEEEVRLIEEENRINPDDIVRQVITTLRPIVIRIIQATVRDSSVDLSNTNNLVQTIMTQLRPVVVREVRSAISATGSTSLDAQDLSNKIITQLRPFVVTGVKKEVKVIKKTQTVSKPTSDQDLIATIIAKLQPIIVQTVKDAQGSSQQTTFQVQQVQSSGPSQGDLIAQIIAKLRPVISNTVQTTLGGGSSTTVTQTTQTQSVRPVRPARPSRPVVTQVTTFEETSSNAQGGQLVANVISQLRPFIVSTVQGALGSGAQLTVETQQQASQNFLANIRPMIKRIVISVMQRQTGSFDRATIIRQVMSELQSNQLLGMIEEEVQLVLGSQAALPPKSEFEALLEELMPEIRAIIIEEIRIYRQQNELSATVSSQIVSAVVSSLRGQVVSVTNSVMTANPSASQETIIQLVINQMQSLILSAVEQAGRANGFTITSSFKNTAAFDQLMATITQQLRALIIQQIQIFQAQQVQVVTKPVVTNKVASIFGTGGRNTVRVETPDFNYGYETDRK